MPPFDRPDLPERYSSLVAMTTQQKLKEIKTRKVSAASQISIKSTAKEFMDAKEQQITIDLEYLSMLREGLSDAYMTGALQREAYNEVLKDVDGAKRIRVQELIIHKRQKKFLADDIVAELPGYSSMEAAYAYVLVNKVMSANGKHQKSKFLQAKFRRDVDTYYNAARVEGGQLQAWCHALGLWVEHERAKAAHLVAKSLDGQDIGYLFGVKHAFLTDPRNALVLLSKIEIALDTGLIVLVPDNKKQKNEISWKIILTDKSMLDLTVESITNKRWKNFDGEHLKFLGKERPAKRFLYFRFVITYLNAKRAGVLPWVSEVEDKGMMMWATPGPYLRRSMLVSLARQISDHYLPEVFLEGTFTEADGSPELPIAEENIATLALTMKIEDEIMNQEERRVNERKEDDDEVEEEDDEAGL